MQAIERAQARHEGDHDGPTRLHRLGRRRKEVLHADARLHRACGPLHRREISGQGRRRQGVRRARSTRRWTRHRTTRRALAAILPWLRGQVSAAKAFHRHGAGRREHPALRQQPRRPASRGTGHELPGPFPAHEDQAALRGLESADGIDPPTLKQKLTAGLEQYRQDYAAYYERCKHANSPAMRDPNPTVVLIPGLGMVAWGKDKSESRVTAEFYNCAVEVMRGAEAIDEYIALPQQEAFDIEYWLLEEAKLQRMPAEKELARQIHVVIGAGSGIGKEVDATARAGRRAHRRGRSQRGRRAGDREGNHRQIRRGHRRGRVGHFRLWPGGGSGGEHHGPREHPRDARSGRAGLRRVRRHRGDGGYLSCRATRPATSPTTNGC